MKIKLTRFQQHLFCSIIAVPMFFGIITIFAAMIGAIFTLTLIAMSIVNSGMNAALPIIMVSVWCTACYFISERIDIDYDLMFNYLAFECILSVAIISLLLHYM